MSYSEDDLGLFATLRDTEDLEGTAYFELHPGELPEPFACWLQGSIFIRDAAFDFLAECFQRANPKFDYFAVARFESGHLDALAAELGAFSGALERGCERRVLFANYASLFTRDIWDGVPTESLRDAISRTNADVLAFVRQTRQEEKPLWVLGM